MSKTGVELIADERQEQIKKHKRTIAKDVKNNSELQLRKGAIGLICKRDGTGTIEASPSDWDKQTVIKMLQKSYKDRLVVAGALLAAEIDRLIAIDEGKQKAS